MSPYIEDGSHHFFDYLNYAMECLSEELWEKIAVYFVLNSYFAHPENLLLSCLLSSKSSDFDKERALVKIKEFRQVQRKSKAKRPRKFIPPDFNELNFSAETLFDLINWDTIAKSKKTPPPIMQNVTGDFF